MRTFVALLLTLAVANADPLGSQRIVGGSLTTINSHPEMVSILYSATTTGHRHWCGGIIVNQRSILSAAHCTYGHVAARFRARAGSSFAHSGGVLYVIGSIINNVSFNNRTLDNDITILRTSANIVFTNVIQAARLAGSNYVLFDNDVVWAAGWGDISYIGGQSEQLRNVQLRTVNQIVCSSRHASVRPITDNMLCSGWLDIGGYGQCAADFGGPLYHNGVVVGISSWAIACGSTYYPNVNVRVSRYTAWIQNNA